VHYEVSYEFSSDRCLLQRQFANDVSFNKNLRGENSNLFVNLVLMSVLTAAVLYLLSVLITMATAVLSLMAVA